MLKRFIVILLTAILILNIVDVCLSIANALEPEVMVSSISTELTLAVDEAPHQNYLVAATQQKNNKTKHLKEYPYAAKIWYFLKDKGYNDYVCAGILGNIMVEVGGGTLKLKPNAYGKGYYGICQWGRHYPKVWGTSLDYHCNFLESTIRSEFKTFGKLYQKGFNYDKFTALTNEREAALAFAKCYERCSAKGYVKRQNCAEIAYNYFT